MRFDTVTGFHDTAGCVYTETTLISSINVNDITAAPPPLRCRVCLTPAWEGILTSRNRPKAWMTRKLAFTLQRRPAVQIHAPALGGPSPLAPPLAVIREDFPASARLIDGLDLTLDAKGTPMRVVFQRATSLTGGDTAPPRHPGERRQPKCLWQVGAPRL